MRKEMLKKRSVILGLLGGLMLVGAQGALSG